MPTKTKPAKGAVHLPMDRIALSNDRRNELSTILGCGGSAQRKAIAEVELRLTTRVHAIQKAKLDPLPANLLAELRPVVDAAKKLALRMVNLSHHKSTLIKDTGVLTVSLHKWSIAGQNICDELERAGRDYQAAVKAGAATPLGGSDGGSRKRNVSKAIVAMDEDLREVYRKYAVSKTKKKENEFVRIATVSV